MRELIHPGETLREDLDALGMSASELAVRFPRQARVGLGCNASGECVVEEDESEGFERSS